MCPYDNCPVKAFKKQQERDRLNQDVDKKKKLQGGKLLGSNLENSALLFAQAKALYLNGLKKFPQHVALRIDFANFLQSRMKDRKGALAELAAAEKAKPPLDQQFMIYRQRRIIEDELTEGLEHGSVDYVTAMNFESQFKTFLQ